MQIDDTNTEALLTARMMAGEQSAFDALYTRYYEAVFTNAIIVLKNNAAAEDIVQEVFLALWEKRNALRHPENIAGWLFVTTSNKSLNYLRRQLRQRLSNTPPEALSDIMYVSEDENQLEEAQLQVLQEAIDSLPPQRKKVFELCKLQGYSYEQAAAALGISKHTIKEHMSDAFHTIREYITSRPGDTALYSSLLAAFLSAAG